MSSSDTGHMPVRGNIYDWNVHTAENAVAVLSDQGYGTARSFHKRLEDEPDRPFRVNVIAHKKGLSLAPGQPLRQTLERIAQTHLVDVVPFGSEGYVPWTGSENDPDRIIGIRISVRAEAQAA